METVEGSIAVDNKDQLVNNDSDTMNLTTEAHELLRKYWGYHSFRPNQLETILNTTSGRDSLLLLATGCGKSITFQLPPLLLRKTMLVISPLRALMLDQTTALTAMGIPAVALHSEQDDPTAERRALNGEFTLIYMAPERLMLSMDKIQSMVDRNLLCGVAIDEAHSLSESSADFRPDYLKLECIRSMFPSLPITAVTATATKRIEADIICDLGLRDPMIIRTSFNRPNIHYSIRKRTTLEQDLTDDLLHKGKDELCIVYCSSRKETERIAKHLCMRGHKAAAFHANLPPEVKKQVHNDFMAEKIHIVCATSAFGVGIDISSIRLVVNYELPRSIEAFAQSSGRGGRDGLPCRNVMFINGQDIMIRQKMMDKDKAEGRAMHPKAQQLFDAVCKFVRSKTCHRAAMLAYFDEDTSSLDCNYGCDICDDSTSSSSAAASSSSRGAKRSTVSSAIKVKADLEPLTDVEEGVYQDLRVWRQSEAKGQATFMVFPDKVLHQLAQIRPTTLGALSCISGIGDKKSDKYGASLLARLEEYSNTHGLPTNVGIRAAVAASTGSSSSSSKVSSVKVSSGAKRPRLSSSAEETWKMIHGLGDDDIGKLSMERVAELRGIKPNTVVDHLMQCLESGNEDTTGNNLDWSLVKVDKSVYNKVARALDAHHTDADEDEDDTKELSFYQLKSAMGALQPSQYNMVKLARFKYYANRTSTTTEAATPKAIHDNKRPTTAQPITAFFSHRTDGSSVSVPAAASTSSSELSQPN